MIAPEVAGPLEIFKGAERPGPDKPKSDEQRQNEKTALELKKRTESRQSLYGSSRQNRFGSSENRTEADVRIRRLLGV